MVRCSERALASLALQAYRFTSALVFATAGTVIVAASPFRHAASTTLSEAYC